MGRVGDPMTRNFERVLSGESDNDISLWDPEVGMVNEMFVCLGSVGHLEIELASEDGMSGLCVYCSKTSIRRSFIYRHKKSKYKG